MTIYMARVFCVSFKIQTAVQNVVFARQYSGIDTTIYYSINSSKGNPNVSATAL